MTRDITRVLAHTLKDCLNELYHIEINEDISTIQKTREDFEGDFTIAVFPYAKMARLSPDIVATSLGDALLSRLSNAGLQSYNVVKGFLNISLIDNYWLSFFQIQRQNPRYGFKEKTTGSKPVVIEYSSPNTNKPLHLGHVRNNLLGNSLARVLEACGHNVIKVNLVNDRGIHICKSMLAWQEFGQGETPESSGIKGDHLVGKYYVEFDKHYREEIAQLQASGKTEDEAKQASPLLQKAQDMLRAWENADPLIRELWHTMNGWVYTGFEKTYQRLGISFHKTYYESDTYILGKKIVEAGLQQGVFYRKADNSVWVDLSGEGLDEKLLLRGDGTSVYITQDLGTAQSRYEEYNPEKMLYVVGNEQIYHFNVLKLVLDKCLHLPVGTVIEHLSYGMVELPAGKMKSREGTVVDADDLMDEMYMQAKKSTEDLGKFDFTPEDATQLYEMLGIGALKYFILKVDPKKNMLFNPAESIDFNGNTAPFIQYTHARIRSLSRKALANNEPYQAQPLPNDIAINKEEKKLLKRLHDFPATVLNAGETYNPSLVANFIYELAKEFNHFYQTTPMLKESNTHLRYFRLQLSDFVATVIREGMNLLGIDVPEKM
ncbi:MAG: arginine--tRNA ligase [Bacteroidales bacterium]|jgi:arginyl-tRNA synthetase|nr:arginine--tRNA ligase [Bacteroidales bacterium]